MEGPLAAGEHLAGYVDERTGIWTPAHTTFTRNTLLYTWGHIAARCIGRGNREYRIAFMYLEFENVAGAAAVPAVGREDGLDYYSGLASSPSRDFLRVAIRPMPDITVAAGYETFLGEYVGNKCTFFAQSQGAAGIHGKPYADTVNSKVVGVALAAAPVQADWTQDVLLSRGYYDAAKQIPKTANRQVGIVYPFTFK
jgi:hypothetical protein